ncbi:MAG: TonB family protein [Gemmatimonadetes bacterium]|nr:TonB family protein [Gemmatimonadota bacterium]
MRRPDPFDRRSLMGSLGIHAVAVSAAVFASVPHKPPPQFVTYQIEIVSPPPARRASEVQEEQRKLVVERPQPTPPAEETPAPVVKPQPEKPKPKPDEQPAERKEAPKPDTPKEAAKENKSATSPDAEEAKSKESGEGINVRLEGLKRDYPAYYGNIITQIGRCFRPPLRGGLEATIYFVINKDGSVSDLSVAKRSGDPAFDISAMGAVECAGKGRFGPLPAELPFDRLPIQFTFHPPGGGDAPPAHDHDDNEQVASR